MINYQAIPIKDISYDFNLIDFTNTHNLLEISKLDQLYIDQIILHLRQLYFISYYKQFLNYLSLIISNILNQYSIMEVYAIDFNNNVIFELLRKNRFDFDHYPKRCILKSKSKHIEEELKLGIMQFVKPMTILDSFNENTIITHPSSMINFIRLMDEDNNAYILHFISNENNLDTCNLYDFFKSYNTNLDLLTELLKIDTNHQYCKMFQYDYKNDKVLYITDQLENEIDSMIYD